MNTRLISPDTLSAEQFSAAEVAPYQFADPARHAAMLQEVDELVELTSHAGQLFSGLHLNHDFGSNPVVARIGGMNNSSTTEAQKYTASQWAAAFPEHPFVAINLPSHGTSDRLTIAQRTERIVKKSGSLMAASMAEAIANHMPDAKDFIITGDSFGAQLVPDVATKLGSMGLNPLIVIGFDMTGVNHFNTGRTFLRLNQYRKTGHSAYHSGVDNETLDAAFENFCRELKTIGDHDRSYNPFKVGKRDPVFTALSILRSATNSESGMNALERSLELNDQMAAAMVSGGLSRICNYRKIAPRVRELEQEFAGRFMWQLWPHDSHSMSIAPQQPRSVAFAKAVVAEYIDTRARAAQLA